MRLKSKMFKKKRENKLKIKKAFMSNKYEDLSFL